MKTKKDFVTFKSFEQFFEHLNDDIDTKKDVYIFGYKLNNKSDYQLIIEDNYIGYYISSYIDFDLLQQSLASIYSDFEDIHIVLDYVYDDSFEDEIFRYKRLSIFRSK